MLLLATGTGAGAAIFAIVNAYLLRPLPYPDSDRIVSVRWETPEGVDAAPVRRELGTLDWSADSEATGALVEAATNWDLDVFTLLGDEGPLLAPGAWVTPEYFRVLGVAPRLGRALQESDLSDGASNVAVISHGLWQSRFGGTPEVLGMTFHAYVSDRPEEAEAFTVVGLMPADFWSFQRYAEVLAPLRESSFPYLLRLKTGVTPRAAAARLTSVAKAHLGSADIAEASEGRVTATPLQERYVGSLRPLLVTLLAAALLVVAIAAGNAAILLLVHTARRRRELAVRSALGAGRDRLVRQLMTEGLLISMVAGVLGLLIAALVLGALDGPIQQQIGRGAPGGAGALRVDLPVVLVVFTVCAGVGFSLGLCSSLMLNDPALGARLRAGSGGIDDVQGSRGRRALVAAGVALSLGLLITAGLAGRSALHLVRADVGFVHADRMVGGIGLRHHSYPTDGDRARFVERLLERLAGTLGPGQAAVSSLPPFGALTGSEVEPEGAGEAVTVGIRSVSADYMSLLSIPVRSGRSIEETDRAAGEPVALVSESLAKRMWPEAQPLGRRLRVASDLGTGVDGGEPSAESEWRVVVGVVADVRETLVGEDLPEVYLPWSQNPSLWMTVLHRGRSSDRAVATVQSALRDLDRGVPLSGSRWLSEAVAEESERSRFLAGVLIVFSLFAVALGLVGLYGVVAHAVLQGRRETAIRLALGAEPGRLVVRFVRQTAATVVLGTAAGLVVAALLAQVLADQLHGVDPTDPLTWLGLPLLLASAALLATWIPARRAARTDPMAVLRSE